MAKSLTSEKVLASILDALPMDKSSVSNDVIKTLAKKIKEYGKFHVTKALKEASTKAKLRTKVELNHHNNYEHHDEVNKESILEAYPSSNIK